MKHSIVFLDALTFGPFDVSALSKLGNFKSYQSTKPGQVSVRCKDASIIITNKVVLSREHFEACPKVELVCITATGTNNVDLKAAKELGVTVCNVPDYASQSVAEHTLALYFALNHRLLEYNQFTRSGKWGKSPVFCHHLHSFRQISQTKWLVVGYGQMGKAMVRLLKELGFQVMVTSQHASQCPVPLVELSEGLAQADVISLHTSLTPNTRNLFSNHAFSLMKKSPIFINVCRGECVDSFALISAVNTGQIAAAGCDVWHPEPPPAAPHLELQAPERLVLTPHVAWTGELAVSSCFQVTYNNVSSYLKSQAQNVVS